MRVMKVWKRMGRMVQTTTTVATIPNMTKNVTITVQMTLLVVGETQRLAMVVVSLSVITGEGWCGWQKLNEEVPLSSHRDVGEMIVCNKEVMMISVDNEAGTGVCG